MPGIEGGGVMVSKWNGVFLAYAVFHLGMDMSLWVSYPGLGSSRAYSVAAGSCVLVELFLVLRLDKCLRSASVQPISNLLIQGLAVGLPWLATILLSLRFLASSSLLPLPPHPLLPPLFNASNLTSISNADFALLLNSTVHLHSPAFSPWPECLLFTSLTQLRVFGWIIMDVVSAAGPLSWHRQDTVVYHVVKDDSYVVTWELDSHVAHAGFTSLPQVTQHQWTPFLRHVPDWEKFHYPNDFFEVPIWARFRISRNQPPPG